MDHGITVGMTVYLEPLNNEARYNNEIKEVKVVKVGREYFYTSPDGIFDKRRSKRFNLKSMLEERGAYFANWRAYRSLQETEHKNERNSLHGKVRMKFHNHHRPFLTIDQLQRIIAIMEEGSE